MYPRVLDAFLASPWAILPAKLAEIQAFLHLKLDGGRLSAEDLAAFRQARAERLPLEFFALSTEAGSGASRGKTVGRVAVLPVFGLLAQRVGMLEDASGGTSCESVARAYDELVADPSVKAIVLNVDSPGGSVFGVDELARKIYGARDEKKTIAVANSTAASAAYWIATSARELHVTPGGQVGSIGVLAAHEDLSKHLEEEHGVKTTLISAGKYKEEGHPSQPLSKEARAAMQAMCDHYYGMFVAAVARNRGTTEATVRNDYGQGRVLHAKDAKAAGMVDGISTLEQVLGRLGVPGGAGALAPEAHSPGLALMGMRQRLAETEE